MHPFAVDALTSKDVLRALCGIGTNCIWSPHRLIAVPNTAWLAGWESDLLLLHRSGWAWEIEIKVSVADFRREFKTKAAKHKTLRTGSYSQYAKGIRIQKYFFAMPKSVYDKLDPSEFPDYAGIVVLDPANTDQWKRLIPSIVRRPKNLPGAEKATDAQRIRLLELAHSRLWAYAYKDDSLLELEVA